MKGKILEALGLRVSDEERESRRRLHEAQDRLVGGLTSCNTSQYIEDRYGQNYSQFLKVRLREAEDHLVGACSCFRKP